jgi:hypothetical protein
MVRALMRLHVVQHGHAAILQHAQAPRVMEYLSLDIEGAESGVIDNAECSLLRRFRILVIELHHLDALGQPFACRRIGEALETVPHELIEGRIVVAADAGL